MKKQDKIITAVIVICLLAFVVILYHKCSRTNLKRYPKALIYKEVIKETHDSVWYQVNEYKLDTTYQEVKAKPKNRLPI